MNSRPFTDSCAEPENQAGVKLIQAVSAQFGEKFPVYAYTSKGPYLLEGSGFDEIARARGKWLFKGKYGPATEQLLLRQDIEEFRLSNSFHMRLARYFWMLFFGSGLLGGLAVWFLTEELPKLAQVRHGDANSVFFPRKSAGKLFRCNVAFAKTRCSADLPS